MEESKTNKNQNREAAWNRFSKGGIFVCKLLILLFFLFLLIYITSFLAWPYSVFLIGIEVSVIVMCCFVIIRMNTFMPKKGFQIPKYLEQMDNPQRLLWDDLMDDIHTYEESSYQYFNGVRAYKYTTVILAGISTIILGLDMSVFKDFWEVDYTVVAKNAALFIGATITVLTTLFAYWNIEKYWLINKTIAINLRSLRDEVEVAYAANELDVNKIKEIRERYNKTKDTFNKYWEGALSERNTGSGQR